LNGWLVLLVVRLHGLELSDQPVLLLHLSCLLSKDAYATTMGPCKIVSFLCLATRLH
jgi:hypothetical protein